MDRRKFIQHAGFIGGAVSLLGETAFANSFTGSEDPWFDKSMRWAQLAFVENDPGRCDPDFWLNYFDKIHADGVLLSAGGIVAFYPTEIPYHHRSAWLGNSDLLGYMVKECRKKNRTIILRTDPHATRQDMYDAHPDFIAVKFGKPHIAIWPKGNPMGSTTRCGNRVFGNCRSSEYSLRA